MERLDIGLGMGGAIGYVRFGFVSTDFTTAGLTQTITLLENPPSPTAPTVSAAGAFQIPQGGAVIGVKIRPEIQIVATSMTSLTCSVGVLGGTGTEFAAPFQVFTAPGASVLQEGVMFKSTSTGAVTVTVTFTSVGANLNAITAGKVDVYICYLNVSTSNIGTSAGVTSVALLPNATGAGVGV